VSNPLSELIKIYDDDESLEVSLVTPVHTEKDSLWVEEIDKVTDMSQGQVR
jgi:hypothetical protein